MEAAGCLGPKPLRDPPTWGFLSCRILTPDPLQGAPLGTQQAEVRLPVAPPPTNSLRRPAPSPSHLLP